MSSDIACRRQVFGSHTRSVLTEWVPASRPLAAAVVLERRLRALASDQREPPLVERTADALRGVRAGLPVLCRETRR
jgi:hypothetical protein